MNTTLKFLCTFLIFSNVAFASDNLSSIDNDSLNDNSSNATNIILDSDNSSILEFTDTTTGNTFVLIDSDNTTFYISTKEIDQQQWLDIMKTRIAMFKASYKYPAENVRYTDVVEFLDNIRKPAGYSYRLPSVQEWSIVADNDLTNNPDDICKYYNLYDITSNDRNRFGNQFYQCTDNNIYTTDTGALLPNKYGVYDIYGNVSEWLCDSYDVNRTGVQSGENYCNSFKDSPRHAVAGGCFSDGPVEMRKVIANEPTTHKFGGLGFRLAIDAIYTDGVYSPKLIEN